jgi:hypothetical protein
MPKKYSNPTDLNFSSRKSLKNELKQAAIEQIIQENDVSEHLSYKTDHSLARANQILEYEFELVDIWHDKLQSKIRGFAIKMSTQVYSNSKRPKRKLNPDAQWLILEKDTVNKIKDQIDYANAFLLRSFRLSLKMEEEEEK